MKKILLLLAMALSVSLSAHAFPEENSSQEASSKNESTGGDEYSKWVITGGLAYGIIPSPKVEGVYSRPWSFGATIGANYNFTKSFYVGARIGYNSVNSVMGMKLDVGSYKNINTTAHVITLPVETGYRWYFFKDKIALVPYLGIDMNCAVSTNIETKDGSEVEKESVKPANPFGVNCRVGARLSLWGLSVGFAYLFTFDKNYGDNVGVPEISISWGF